jgi:hypothetical protein
LATAIGLRPTLLIAAAGGALSLLWLLPSPIPAVRSISEYQSAGTVIVDDRAART